MVVLGVILGVIVVIALVRPTLLGAAFVRATAWMRFWERWLIRSPEGYAATKDAKIKELRKDSSHIVDKLAKARARANQLQEEHAGLSKKEARFNKTRDEILEAASGLRNDSVEYKRLADKLDTVEAEIEKLKAEGAVVTQGLTELIQQIESYAPYLDEIQDKIKKTGMERELGALQLEVAQMRQDRAESFGQLSGRQSVVDHLNEEADTYLREEVERGKIAQERTTSSADAIAKEFEGQVRAKTAAERLGAALREKRGEVPAPASPAAPETLTK